MLGLCPWRTQVSTSSTIQLWCLHTGWIQAATDMRRLIITTRIIIIIFAHIPVMMIMGRERDVSHISSSISPDNHLSVDHNRAERRYCYWMPAPSKTATRWSLCRTQRDLWTHQVLKGIDRGSGTIAITGVVVMMADDDGHSVETHWMHKQRVLLVSMRSMAALGR